MKVSGVVLSMVIASASAFVSPVQKLTSKCDLRSSVKAVDDVSEGKVEVGVTEKAAAPAPAVEIPAMSEALKDFPMVKASESMASTTIETGRYDGLENSIALPFLKRPNALDGTHAGDFGFDPLGFTESYDLYTMQEAELRHARLAMLAVIGWPMSELLAPEWMLQENGCAPSVLNGFNPFSLGATVLFFAAAGFFEYKTSLRRVDDKPLGKLHAEDMKNVWKQGVAGDYNFDPLGLYSCIGDDAVARKGLREVEISHGRSAMLGITGFVLWEKITGHAIVENSMFFHPNLLLPALVAGYAFASSIYEVEYDGQYLKVQTSSEGEARLENLKIGFGGPGISGPASPATASPADSVSDILKPLTGGIEALKKQVGDLTKNFE